MSGSFIETKAVSNCAAVVSSIIYQATKFASNPSWMDDLGIFSSGIQRYDVDLPWPISI